MRPSVWREVWRANQEDGYGVNLYGRIAMCIAFTLIFSFTGGSVVVGLIVSFFFPWLPFAFGVYSEYKEAKRRVDDPEHAEKFQARVDDGLGR